MLQRGARATNEEEPRRAGRQLACNGPGGRRRRAWTGSR